MNQPLVSIIINCFNGQEFLKETLESVQLQTYTNWEIIFWDNQSYDNSSIIFQSFNDSRFKYFYSSNHTLLGEARNLAVEKANGDWLAFLDCDDIWYSEKLELQIEAINSKKENVGLVYGHIDLLFLNNKKEFTVHKLKNNKLPSGNIFNKLLFEDFIPIPTVLINKHALLNSGGISLNYNQCEDYDLILKVAKNYNCIALYNTIAQYRIHKNNLTFKQINLMFDETMSILSKYSDNINYNNAISCHCAFEFYRLFFQFDIKGLKMIIKKAKGLVNIIKGFLFLILKKFNFYFFVKDNLN